MPIWRRVKKTEYYFVLGHIIKKQYFCTVFLIKKKREKKQKNFRGKKIDFRRKRG